MNILFLTTGNISTIEEQGIYSDLLRQFKKNNHNLYIASPVEKRLGLNTEYKEINNVSYLKIKIGNLTKTNIIEKGICTLTLENIFLKNIKKYLSGIKFDLIIYSTPPITFDKVIRYLKKRDRAKTYLLLRDIFPQNAVDLGMFGKETPFYWYFRYKEKKLYKNSDFIGCMSQANVEYILKHNNYINKKNVEICPNSIEPIDINVLEEEKKEIKKKYNIPMNKIIFIYGGNLGKPQGIDFLIECLKKNEENEKSFFLIVGSGTEFERLNKFFEKNKIKNAKLLNYLPKNDYEILANSCDVGLIFLDKRFTIPNFPSRLLSYMQASMPILAATDKNTDIGEIIEQNNFGYWCESSEVKKFNEKLDMLCDEKLRKKMGKEARCFLEENYTTKDSYEIIIKHFK